MRDQIIGALIALCIVSLGGLPSPAHADEWGIMRDYVASSNSPPGALAGLDGSLTFG